MSWIVIDTEEGRRRVAVARSGRGVWVGWPGGAVFVSANSNTAAGAAVREGDICAPLTGKVIRVEVAPGDTVTEDQALIVLEAMKMEHTLTSPRAGTVDKVDCGIGDLVDQGTTLVELAGE